AVGGAAVRHDGADRVPGARLPGAARGGRGRRGRGGRRRGGGRGGGRGGRGRAGVAAAADVQVDAGVEGHRGVGDVPDGEDLLPAAVAGEVHGVGDGHGGPPAAVVEDGDAVAADVVLPGAGGVVDGEGPGEGDPGADRGDGPVLALVAELGEAGDAAVA